MTGVFCRYERKTGLVEVGREACLMRLVEGEEQLNVSSDGGDAGQSTATACELPARDLHGGAAVAVERLRPGCRR